MYKRQTRPLATSQTTRAAIVSVLPLPAPATTSMGRSGASMTAVCSGVGAVSYTHLDVYKRQLHSGPFEPALLGDRGVQPGEEPDERRAVSRRRKIGRDIGKCVQVRPGGVGCVCLLYTSRCV